MAKADAKNQTPRERGAVDPVKLTEVTEEIAYAVDELHKAAVALSNSRLTRRAIVVLLHDETEAADGDDRGRAQLADQPPRALHQVGALMSTSTPLRDFIDRSIDEARAARSPAVFVKGFVAQAMSILNERGDSEHNTEAELIASSARGEAGGLERAAGQLMEAAKERFAVGKDADAQLLRGHADVLREKATQLRTAYPAKK